MTTPSVKEQKKRARRLERDAEKAQHRNGFQEDVVAVLVRHFLEYYPEFLMFEDSVRDDLLRSPGTYDAEMHRELQNVRARWFRAAHSISNLIALAMGVNREIPGSDDFKKHYGMMLSVELMDKGPMPEHVGELAEQAKRDAASDE